MRIKQRVMPDDATDCVLPVLSSKILEEGEAPERDRGRRCFLFPFYSRGTIVAGFFYAFSYETRISFLPLSFDPSLSSSYSATRWGETKGWKGESKMRSWNTKATRRVDSRRNELLAPFRTHSVSSRLVSANVSTRRSCGRAEKAEAFRSFHANQFCMIISWIPYTGCFTNSTYLCKR